MIGEFAVVDELDRYGAGSLFRAEEPSGRPVVLVALRGVDPRVRAERLAAGGEGYRLLPGDGPDRLWAVFPADAADAARQALRSLPDPMTGGPTRPAQPAVPSDQPTDQPSGWSAPHGPEFVPPDAPDRPGPSAPAEAPSPSAISQTGGSPGTRIVGVTVVVAVAVLAVVIAGIALSRRDPGTSTAGAPPAPGNPSPTRHPLATPGPRPNNGLLQEVWRNGDDIYAMDLGGLGFSFRAPGTWNCLRSGKAGVRWVCVDGTGMMGGTRPAHPSGGIIQSDECSAPCGKAAYRDVLARLSALNIDTSGLQRVDARTRVDSRVDPSDPHRLEYRMSRTYDSDGDGRLDRHLWVRLDAAEADREPVKKMLGDLYDATR